MGSDWTMPNAEPTLDELLNEPIVRLLMQGDHTGENEVRQLIARVQTGMASSGDDETSAAKPAGGTGAKKAARVA